MGMDSLSEKLTELISQIQYMGGLESRLAEHLIANGVTIQQWIPVTERLPSIHEDVLMYFKDDDNMVAGYLDDVDEDSSMWSAYSDGGYYTDCDYVPTHWMPLPEPPSGERRTDA